MYRRGIPSNVGRVRVGEQGFGQYDSVWSARVSCPFAKVHKYALSHTGEGKSP